MMIMGVVEFTNQIDKRKKLNKLKSEFGSGLLTALEGNYIFYEYMDKNIVWRYFAIVIYFYTVMLQ